MTISAVSPLPDITAIAGCLDNGVTVITATQRLARHLITETGEHRAPVACLPKILSLDAWLRQTWRRKAESSDSPKRLLSGSEVDALWRDVISRYESKNNVFSLLQPEAAASLAARCRATLKEHRIPVASSQIRQTFESETDTACFLKWLDRLDIRLKQEALVMPEDLPELIAAEEAERAAEVWFLSEEPPTPAVERALSSRFLVTRWFHSPLIENVLPVKAFATRDAEILAAAEWGLTQHQSSINSAIVLADYQRDRPLLEHELRNLFGSADQVFTHLPVNFSRGAELSKVPMFRDALLLLRLMTQSLSRTEITSLIRSPFFSWPDSERNDKGATIAYLFKSKRSVFELRHVLEALGNVTPKGPLESALSRARNGRLSSLRLSPGDWREHVSSILEETGWPSASGLDSVEYQQFELVDGVFDEIEANSLDSEPYSLDVFLSRFRSVLSERLFQPKTDAGRLQVMALADTTGLSFDAVRVVGATSESLPGRPGPLSFIPWEICRSHNVAKTNEEYHVTVASRLIGQLSSSGNVSCTYHRVADGAAKLASRFCAVDNDQKYSEDALDKSASAELEWIDDPFGLATMVPGEQSGGVSLLEQQAACPLKAHLNHKLGIKALDEEAEGLTAGERGGVLHEALKHLFTSLPSSEHIKGLPETAQIKLIEEAADDAVRGIKASVRDRVGLSALDLERQRLQTVLSAWLEVERSRQIAFNIELNEAPIDWDCEGLSLSLKVDRVDMLSTGQRIVIDYKSSAGQTVADWSQSPVKSPQLPCYSQVLANVGTIAIGQVSTKEPSYLTLGGEIGLFDVDKKNKKAMDRADITGLDDLKDQWLNDLRSLVSAFVEGSATPTPSPSACRYCHYTSVCRAHLTSDWNSDEESTLE